MAKTRTARDVSTFALFLLLPCVGTLTAKASQTKESKVSAASAPQFRKTHWGMSRQDLKKTESRTPFKDKSDRVIYQLTVAGMPCLLVYSLVDDKLVRADYIFEQEHNNPGDYIEDFRSVEETMAEKYGKPDTDGPIWGDDPYDVKDAPQYWGMAIAEGYLKYSATWETPLTTINLLLSGDNYKSVLAAHYASKELSELQKKTERDKAVDQF